MSKPKKTRPMLLSDRILLLLNGGGPRTHPELAELIGTTIGSIRTANSFNRSMGYIETVGNSMNRAAGHVHFQITEDGQERVKYRLSSKFQPKLPSNAVREPLLRKLRAGPLSSHDWQGLTNSRKALWSQIHLLRKDGYVIESNHKPGLATTYILRREPEEQPI